MLKRAVYRRAGFRFCLVMLMCMALVVPGFIGPADSYAAADTTAPKIKSIKLNSDSFKYGQKITMTLELEEKESGIADIFIDYNRKLSSTSGEGVGFWKNFTRPQYSGTITLELNSILANDFELVGGMYEFGQIQIEDFAGNIRCYDGYIDENGTLYSRDRDNPGIKCQIKGKSTFAIDDGSDRSIKIKSLKFGARTVTNGGKIPVEFELEGGKPGRKYTIYMRLASDRYGRNTEKITVTYASKVNVKFTAYDMDMGNYCPSSVYIKADGDRSFKDYGPMYHDDSGLQYLDEDICEFIGNRYITVKSKSGKSELPQITNVRVLTPEVTKPGVVRVAVASDLMPSDIHQLNITFSRLNSNEYIDRIFSAEEITGTYELRVPSSQQAGEYYLSQIVIYDSEGNVGQLRGNVYSPDFFNFTRATLAGEEESDLFSSFDAIPVIKVLDEFDVAFESSLNDPSLVTKVRNMEDGRTARIHISEPYTASREVFEAIKGTDKILHFTGKYYQWIFRGTDIINPKDVRLNLKIDWTDGADYDLGRNVLAITCPDNGQLPGKSTVRIKSDYAMSLFNSYEKSKIYLYCCDTSGKSISLENKSGIDVYLDGSNSWCTFNITHTAKFLASGKKTANTKLPLKKGTTFRPSGSKLTYKVLPGRNVAVIKNNDRKIKAIAIPETVSYQGVKYKVTEIGSNVFAKCNKLKTVTIGANVSKIGSKAFYNCKKLSTINIKSNLLKMNTVGSNAFKKVKSKSVVKVNKKVRTAYTKILKKKGFSGKKQKVRAF